MGIKSLLKKLAEYANDDVFTPDFEKTEYDNWIDFMGKGGTTEAWNKLKKAKGWKFKRDPIETFQKYEKEFRPVFNQYDNSSRKIKEIWTAIYHAKDYNGKMAESIEKECINNIILFKKMMKIWVKYNESPMTQAEGYKRLLMLYEKQGRYDEAISVCKDACGLGIDESSRLIRMIKKADRCPNTEEELLLEKFVNSQ